MKLKKNIDIKAVIFDLDGTVTDTEGYYHDSWKRALEDFGYEHTEERLLSLRSLGRPFAPEKFREWYGEGFDYNAVRERRKKYVKDLMDKNGIPLKPGALEIIAYLKNAGIKTAVATANDRDRTEMYLSRIHMKGCFDEIICADMVKQGKPAPDIYKYACEKLGFDPGEIIAVEDSPNGITSAYIAGCNVVMVPDMSYPDDEIKKMLYACVETLNDISNVM